MRMLTTDILSFTGMLEADSLSLGYSVADIALLCCVFFRVKGSLNSLKLRFIH